MPGKDGFHVLKYVQKHRPGLPVILLSGMPVDDIEDKIHLLPSRELPPLMLKPVDAIQLLELIDMELSGELPQSQPPKRERN
jgi:DNA-binding response OmpR family regulator